MISKELVDALRANGFELKTRYKKIKTNKIYSKEFTINRFPIACYLGYYWAKRKGYNENLSKALGYAIALAPNIAKASHKWASGFYDGVPLGQGHKYERNDDKMINKYGDKKDTSWETITFGNWVFIWLKNKNTITLSKMRTLTWWDKNDYERKLSVLSKKQLSKLIKRVRKELDEITPDEIEYKYAKNYRTFWQPLMDRLRKNL